MKAYEILKERIENKAFGCEEDAIDAVVRDYKLGLITKAQRIELLRMV